MIELEVLNPNVLKGRGAQINPHNRFDKTIRSNQFDQGFDYDEEVDIKTSFQDVYPKTIVNKVESDDVPFGYSLNPYQGCEHGCIYCYARNSHNYWGYSAGLDFESKILVKRNAPELLDKLLSSRSWQPVPIMLSGNTDCYQPIEKSTKITRRLLEVFLKHRHPVSLITKNSLIIRDLDILQQLSKHNLVSVAISINTINDDVRRKLEPRTSTIDKRLQTAKTLVQAGIPITVLAAPIIPGLNDFDIIPLVKKVAAIGVKRLHHIVVRLNGDVSEIFTDWLQKTYPDREQKITSKIKSLHGGQVNDSRTGVRMRGEGVIADIIKQQFSLAKKLYGVTGSEFVHDLHHYKAPKAMQLSLF